MIGCFIEDWTDWTLTNVDDEVKCYFNNTSAITMLAILCLCVSFIRMYYHQIPLSSDPMIIPISLWPYDMYYTLYCYYDFYCSYFSDIMCVSYSLSFLCTTIIMNIIHSIYIYVCVCVCIFCCIMYMFNMFRYNVLSCCLYKNRITWIHN